MDEVHFCSHFPLSPCLEDYSALWSQCLSVRAPEKDKKKKSQKSESPDILKMLVWILS